MGEVISLARVVERRAERRRERAAHAGMHPALRWIVGGNAFAHRRVTPRATACGLSGLMLLAETTARLCPDCYTPHKERG